MREIWITIERLMVMVHHSWLSILLCWAVGIGGLVLACNLQQPMMRKSAAVIAVVALAFILTTGMVVAPLDNREHQHGGCLLDKLR